MQRDTYRKFGEKHGTKENLIQSIEHIIDVALVKPDEVDPLKLRFVTPLQIPTDLSADGLDWPAYYQSPDYRLTSTEEHSLGLEYISVSYCWKQYVHSPQMVFTFQIIASRKDLNGDRYAARHWYSIARSNLPDAMAVFISGSIRSALIRMTPRISNIICK